ncbi:MAG: exonuclease III [Hyphomicrobiaceae bacterium]|jgi:exonuclease III
MRLLSLNVERSAHLDRFIPFLRDTAPDVACLQELVESDIAEIQAATDLTYCHFVAMARFSPDQAAPFGVGILSRHAFRTTNLSVYAGGGDGGTVIDRASPESRFATIGTQQRKFDSLRTCSTRR